MFAGVRQGVLALRSDSGIAARSLRGIPHGGSNSIPDRNKVRNDGLF